jgi:hypothetical protein
MGKDEALFQVLRDDESTTVTVREAFLGLRRDGRQPLPRARLSFG